jgi:hypothetical protein
VIAGPGFAEAIFIGMPLPSDCHTPRWDCGNPGRLVWVTTLGIFTHPMTVSFAMRIPLRTLGFPLIVPGFVYGQTATQTDSSASTSDLGLR